MLVQLAACRADQERFNLAANQGLFSPPQLEAVSRRRPEDQRRTVAGRWLLKRLLRAQVPDAPFPPRLTYGWQEKPLLADYPEVGFNLSHSGDWAVCALCGAPVGVDIQVERPLRASLIRRFSPAEQQMLNTLPPAKQQPALYDLWCLKEAYCKCTGDGLRTPLNATTFTLSPVAFDREGYRAALIPFPDEKYHLAVCVETGEEIQVKLRIYP